MQKTNTEIYNLIDKLRAEIKAGYVSIERVAPLERIVYGFVGVVLLGFVSALLALVFKGL